MKRVFLQNSTEEALVSDSDFESVNVFLWQLDQKGYVFRYLPMEGRRQLKEYLHVFLLGKRAGHGIDHKDTNPLNNQRDNLRFATDSQNQANSRKRVGTSSLFKGVTWQKLRDKWQANIRVRGLPIYLGSFLQEEDAARAYDSAALEHFGEFARPNFPND